MKIPEFIVKDPARAVVGLSSLIGGLLLGMALIAQYGFGLQPCHLCIAQRVPYALIWAVGTISLYTVKSPKLMARIAAICILLFIVDGGIAFYHAGVEWGIFTGPSGCTNTGHSGETLEEMRAAIMNAPLVPCDQAMAYFFGLSMAAWNAIAAFGSAVLLALTWKKAKA